MRPAPVTTRLRRPGLRTASALAALVAAACGAGAGRERCNPGQSRACTVELEGGASQAGTQSCGPDRVWAECVGVGSCAGAGAAVAPYDRCAADGDCGPSSCGACAGHSGVQNPHGYAICSPFCATDADCAPSTPSTDVAPRCALGQCVLLCHAGPSVCPGGGQCLPWADATTAMAYPGFDGLCD